MLITERKCALQIELRDSCTRENIGHENLLDILSCNWLVQNLFSIDRNTFAIQ